MTLTRRLQFSMAVTASLGSVTLGIAEGNPLLGALAAMAAFTSVYFTDIKGWLVLSTNVANLLGVATLALTLRNWQLVDRELLFISMANLLVYLQCILFYRRKAPRVYWMLLLLSFLQVAVASVLIFSYLFGVLMIVYMFMALRTLALFAIHREQNADRLLEEERGADGRDRLSIWDLFSTPIHKLPDLLRFSGPRRPQRYDVSSGPTCWPLSADESSLSAIRPNHESQDVTRGLWRYIAKMGLAALLIGPTLFFVVPRTSGRSSLWQTDFRSGPSLTGFTDNISLQDVTQIRENADDVMRVKFFRYENGRRGEPYKLKQEPYLRGAVLVKYTGAGWNPSGKNKVRLDDGYDGRSENDVVLQEITLEPVRNSDLAFAVAPVYAISQQTNAAQINFDDRTEQLFRPAEWGIRTVTYQLLTTGFKNGRQVPFRRERRSINSPMPWETQIKELLQPFKGKDDQSKRLKDKDDLSKRLKDKDDLSERLKPLEEMASKEVERRGLDPVQDPRAVALALERFLSVEGGYSYTLAPPPRDPTRDPVVDFLENNRQGHCEYFASALALMLRSQEIPARVVVGYRGGTWNAVGGYYQIQQLHAHAWVEAWIFKDGRPSGWLRLDPTPSSDNPQDSVFTSFWQVTNYLEYIWAVFVLDMDAELQRKTVFEPLSKLFHQIVDTGAWKDWLHDLRSVFRDEGWNWKQWINWRAGLTFSAAALLLALIYKLIRILYQMRRFHPSKTAPSGRDVPRVEFYRRFEHLLARCGLTRSDAQTQREFALAAAEELATEVRISGVETLTASIVSAYYRVRFGGEELWETDQRIVEEALANLEAMLPTKNEDIHNP